MFRPGGAVRARSSPLIDSSRGRYYTAGVNATTHKVNLCVWSLKGGYKVACRDLPFESSVFVGTGQALNVDPTDGTIIVMGHDPTRGGHHAIYTLDPDTFKPTFVADIGGDMHFDMLGASTTYDHDEKTVYVITSYNGTNPSSLKANVKGPPPPAPKINISFSAIELTTGKVTNLTKDLIMGGFVYDSKTKRVYGTHVTQSNGESVDARDAAVWRGRNGKKGPFRMALCESWRILRRRSAISFILSHRSILAWQSAMYTSSTRRTASTTHCCLERATRAIRTRTPIIAQSTAMNARRARRAAKTRRARSIMDTAIRWTIARRYRRAAIRSRCRLMRWA